MWPESLVAPWSPSLCNRSTSRRMFRVPTTHARLRECTSGCCKGGSCCRRLPGAGRHRGDGETPGAARLATGSKRWRVLHWAELCAGPGTNQTCRCSRGQSCVLKHRLAALANRCFRSVALIGRKARGQGCRVPGTSLDGFCGFGLRRSVQAGDAVDADLGYGLLRAVSGDVFAGLNLSGDLEVSTLRKRGGILRRTTETDTICAV
jgi:hypothetical protein